MANEVGAYEVHFSHEPENVTHRVEIHRLVIARNADNAIGVVRGSFPTAEIVQVIKRFKAEDILADPAVSFTKQVVKEEEEDSSE